MLIAKTSRGQLVRAFDADMTEKKYFCPACLGRSS